MSNFSGPPVPLLPTDEEKIRIGMAQEQQRQMQPTCPKCGHLLYPVLASLDMIVESSQPQAVNLYLPCLGCPNCAQLMAAQMQQAQNTTFP